MAKGVVDQYLGDYELNSGMTKLGNYKLNSASAIRVFLFDEKPYVHLPGVGDVQMFSTARKDSFTVRVVRDMNIAFERGANDDVASIALTSADDTIRASKARK